MTQRIKAMLVVSQATARADYRAFLSGNARVEVMAEAERGEDACRVSPGIDPDVVVMELALPGSGGLAALRRVAKRFSGGRILALIDPGQVAWAARALRMGVGGCAARDGRAWLEAVDQLAAGRKYLEPRIARSLALRSVERAGKDDSAIDALSPSEFDVFCLLAQGHALAEAAAELRISQRTVANYAALLKSKLKLHSIQEMGSLADEYGLSQG